MFKNTTNVDTLTNARGIDNVANNQKQNIFSISGNINKDLSCHYSIDTSFLALSNADISHSVDFASQNLPQFIEAQDLGRVIPLTLGTINFSKLYYSSSRAFWSVSPTISSWFKLSYHNKALEFIVTQKGIKQKKSPSVFTHLEKYDVEKLLSSILNFDISRDYETKLE